MRTPDLDFDAGNKQTLVILKNLGFSAPAVLALAIGFGAHTGSLLLDASLLRPLPYKDTDRLMALVPLSYPKLLDLRTRNKSFQEFAGFTRMGVNLTGEGEPERISVAQVSANLFRTLGVPPVLGRDFQVNEDGSSASRVAILSQELWQRRMHSDPAAIGKALALDGDSYTIVGVMPREFYFPSRKVELWTPLAENANRRIHFLSALARLKPGVAEGQARTEIGSIERKLQMEYPQYGRGVTVTIAPLDEWFAEASAGPWKCWGGSLGSCC